MASTPAEPSAVFRPERRLTEGPLAGRVASATGYRSSGGTAGVHRGLPSPWLTFIVSFDAPVRMLPDDLSTGTGTDINVVLAGLHQRATLIDSPAAEAGIQLAIEPTACRALFGMPAAEIAHATHEADAVVGAGITALRDRMHEAGDSSGELLRGWLTGRPLAGAARPDVAEAWRLITRTGGRMRIDDVARRVALSPRQLRATFAAEYGLTPKAAARITRLDAVTTALALGVRRGRRVDLASLALTTGYADQPHLAREFRDAVGLSITEWLTEERRNLQAGGHTNGTGWDT